MKGRPSRVTSSRYLRSRPSTILSIMLAGLPLAAACAVKMSFFAGQETPLAPRWR